MSLHQLSTYEHTGCLQSTHERAPEGRLVSFFFPLSLPVSNQDKSSASEEVLPF